MSRQQRSRERLAIYVNQGLSYGADYKAGLSNHLPMALTALYRLGGTEEQLEALYESMVRHLEPLADATVRFGEDGAKWTDHLGEHAHNAAYRMFFRREISARGLQDTLSTYLPRLIRGVGGGAFHPLIRLSYGLRAGHADEIAEALAAWAMAYLDLGEPASDGPMPLIALEQLGDDDRFESLDFAARNIFLRMERVAAQPAFDGFGGLSPKAKLADLLEAAVQVYAGSQDNFTALHLVTASHALLSLSGVVPSIVSTGLPYFWRAAGAAFVTIGRPQPVATVAPPEHDWPAIRDTACAARDDHVIKFVYSCSELFGLSHDPRLQSLAARKAGLR